MNAAVLVKAEIGNSPLDYSFPFCYLCVIVSIDPETLKQWEKELLSSIEHDQRQLAHVRALLSGETSDEKEQEQQETQAYRASEGTFRFLSQHGRSASRREILQNLERHGINFGGQDPLRTFAAMVLNRDPRFIPMGGRGMWGLAEWQSEDRSKE